MLAHQNAFKIKLSDGAEVTARREGNPNGVRLFVTHGNGFAVDGYKVFWQPLLADYDVILFDMRNHGHSVTSTPSAHHYERLAVDIGEIHHDVTKRFGKKRSVGVFHSFSARAAMKHAVEMCWIWDELVLFDPPSVPPIDHRHYALMRQFEVKLVDWALSRQDTFSSVDELLESYRNNRAQSRWVDAARADMAQAILNQDGSDKWRLKFPKELEASIYLQALTLDLWPPASAFSGPVKLIGADPEAKGASPTGLANQALGQENGYVYEAIPDTGHLLQIERPDECRAALLSFIQAYN